MPIASTVAAAPASREGFLTLIYRSLRGAVAAAHTYEDLSRLSDAALARRGIKRTDIPQIAARALEL